MPATYDKQFSDAMVKLEKGKYTDAPVRTRFGFHIIQLDDVRPATFAALAEVKPRIQQMLVQNKIEELVKGASAGRKRRSSRSRSRAKPASSHGVRKKSPAASRRSRRFQVRRAGEVLALEKK